MRKEPFIMKEISTFIKGAGGSPLTPSTSENHEGTYANLLVPVILDFPASRTVSKFLWILNDLV
jgi:hypothetical protein